MLHTKGKLSVIVDEKMTAKEVGSGSLEVFATPALLALVEKTAWTSISDQIEEGKTTVGINADFNHVKATALGVEVICETEVVDFDGKKIVFEFEVKDEFDLISKGRHERAIVNVEKFLSRLQRK